MEPLEKVEKVIMELGGPITGEGFMLLCFAILEAENYEPGMFQMKEIYACIKRYAGNKTVQAIAKAVERQVKDICRYGDSDKLKHYRAGWADNSPPPKEFISIMSMVIKASG